MLDRRPVIGIVSYGRGSDPEKYSLPVEYVSAVRRAGGRVVIVPPGDDSASAILAGVDGVILAGGGDIDPSRYGQAAHRTVYDIDPERDTFELDLGRQALAQRVPALAVCRGLQVINVALGGDLVQHLPDVVSDRIAHRGGAGQSVDHHVRLSPKSRLASVCGATSLRVPSRHHQGPNLLGEGLRPVAWADDDTVEALEADGHPELLAVQWHPEETADRDPAHQRLFDWLVDQARGRAGRRESL